AGRCWPLLCGFYIRFCRGRFFRWYRWFGHRAIIFERSLSRTWCTGFVGQRLVHHARHELGWMEFRFFQRYVGYLAGTEDIVLDRSVDANGIAQWPFLREDGPGPSVIVQR